VAAKQWDLGSRRCGPGSIDEFSSRHAEIDEVRKALEMRLGREVTAEERNQVALATRSAKRPVDPNDLRKDWLTRADRVGLDIGSCFDRIDRAVARDVLPDDLRDRLFGDLVDPIVGLCARSTMFGRGDVMRAVADWSIVNHDGDRVKVLVPPREVERLTARFCATGLVAEIDTSGVIRRRDGAVVRDGQDEPTFTTIELLDVEAQIVSVVGGGIAAGDGIVDEASTIGDRDLLRLCDLATDTGATLRLIGDPAQHGSVPAGGSFNELVNLYADRTPQLATVHRLTDAGERRRADLVRSGRVDDAIDELQASGQLVLTANEHDTHAAMLARWYTERTAGRPHPMVHGRDRERRVLNALAQQMLIEDGTVEANEYAVLGGGRRLCIGDQVVARHGDRTIHPVGNRNGWMRNGTTGRVVEVRTDPARPEGDEIDISIFDGIITCDRATFDRSNGGIDLAYAVTSYAVQGATNDVSTSAVTASTSRSELYVDITRGRHHNQIYGTRPVSDNAATHLDEHLPRLTNELGPTLRTRLARSAPRTALGTDPTAPDTARLRRGRTLAELVAARHRGEIGPESAKAIANAEAAVRRVAEHELPAAIRSVLPECPTSPHLAEQWQATAADVAVFLAVESPRTSHDQRGLPGLIGSRSNAIDPARWDRTAQSLRGTATEIVCRQLVDQHAGTAVATTVRYRPEWLIEHLHALADSGKLATADTDRLATLIVDVTAWRVERELIDRIDPSTPLGPVPTDPSDRARHAQLARRLADPSKRDPGRGIARE
jgi:hypothetical protein